jgi:hypothetical protein
MNEARLEELKRLLDERHQNLEQGSQEDFSAQNFDIPNSDASNLNSSNSKILNFNDKNLDGSNSNTKDDSKFQNLYSSQATSNKNSKTQARDYDEAPIIIKDNSIEMIRLYLPIVFILDVLLHFAPYRPPRPGELNERLKELGTCYIKFKNSAIEYFSTKKNLILFEIELSNIAEIKRTFGPSSEFQSSIPTKKLILSIIIIYFVLMSAVFYFKGYAIAPFVVPIAFGLGILPLLIFRLVNGLGLGLDILGSDSLIIFDKHFIIDASILTSKQYKELKTYFLLKTGKNLDKIRPQIFI